MDHKPYETWLVSEEPLSPDDKQRLQEHIDTCQSCRQLSISWREVHSYFQDLPMDKPSPAFTNRWQSRLADFKANQLARREKRTSWLFVAASAGAAIFVLSIMMVQLFSSIQAPIQLFITGATMVVGFLNLASAIQVALLPFIELVIVSVPTIWWFIIAFTACVLTLVLTFSAKQILFPRRVSL